MGLYNFRPGRGSSHLRRDLDLPNRPARHPMPEWEAMVNWLQRTEQVDIKKTLCIGCGTGRLWDNKGQQYNINGRFMNLKELRDLVDRIRLINQQ